MNAQAVLKWKRKITRLLWDTEYNTTDGGDRFMILRNRKLRWVKLFIWRGARRLATECYMYLPSVKLAKRLAETRRRCNADQDLEPVIW